MRTMSKGLIAATLIAMAAPAFGQEMIINAERRSNAGNPGVDYTNYSVITTARPTIALKRNADYFLVPVRITGATARIDELRAMVLDTIARADQAGIELGTGDYVVDPLTKWTYRNLPFASDGRSDTSSATFFGKVKLAPGVKADNARAIIADFLATVPKVARSSMAVAGEPLLSVVKPDQYRGALIEKIAADATASAAKFGPDYGVEVAGLDRPVEWVRAGPIEVFLFLPATYTVKRS